VTDESDVVERARAGDPAAWRELYLSLTGRLLVWLRARPSGDVAADPDDLVMETWLVAAERIADFRGDESDFAGWLFGIARRQAANARRRTSRRATTPGEVPDAPGTSTPEPEVAGADWVRHTLSHLPPREADVLACLDVTGLDVATTAAALGISPAAVRVAHHRGLRRLRRSWAEIEREGPEPVVDASPSHQSGPAGRDQQMLPVGPPASVPRAGV
jgi:RNA polymerase sigma-70 factor (ECF subfamily)